MSGVRVESTSRKCSPPPIVVAILEISLFFFPYAWPRQWGWDHVTNKERGWRALLGSARRLHILSKQFKVERESSNREEG